MESVLSDVHQPAPERPHHKIWPKRLPRELVIPDTTLFFNLEVTARRFPDKAAYLFCGRSLSYSQLKVQAEAVAGWLQSVAWCLPTSYVFEGMRGVLLEAAFKWDLVFGAVALNAVYVAAGVGIFFAAFRGARQRGALLQMGE